MILGLERNSTFILCLGIFEKNKNKNKNSRHASTVETVKMQDHQLKLALLVGIIVEG
jgi:hypothetical protein